VGKKRVRSVLTQSARARRPGAFTELLERRVLLNAISLAAGIEYPMLKPPQVMASADFNGDGKLDLAMADSDGKVASVLLGAGDGSFATDIDTTVSGGTVRALQAGDFNADGKMDLAVCLTSGFMKGSVAVFLGNGNGTFQNQRNCTVNADAWNVATADFDNDGKSDLAVLNAASVSILRSNGDGTFQPKNDYSGTGWTMAVGDFNGDGNADLAVLGTTTTVTVLQ
jgi:hypothetical protein